MDAAQLQSLIRHILTALGVALAGTGFAKYFSADYVNVAVEFVGFFMTAFGTFWGHQSNAPVALAQKLVDSNIPNVTIANAIATNSPEKLAVKP